MKGGVLVWFYQGFIEIYLCKFIILENAMLL